MNKKQKQQHLGAIKSAFYVSAMAAIDEHLVGSKSIIWSRLDNASNAKKVKSKFQRLFSENVDALMHEDYESVKSEAGKSHDQFVAKAAAHFDKIIDKHGSDFNYSVLQAEVAKLDDVHAKHI